MKKEEMLKLFNVLKKILIGTMYIPKIGKKVKIHFVDLVRDKTKSDYYIKKDSVKKFYKKLANGLKKSIWYLMV